MPQRLYLRFLYAKRAVCSWVQEFAAYFRAAIPEVRKNRDRPTRLRFYTSATCGFVAKNRVMLGDFRFSPHFRKTRQRRASRSENRYEFRWKNNLLNAKTAFRRFPRTKPDVPSQGLITVETLRNNPIPVNHYPNGTTTVELNRKADLRQVKWPPYSASSNILNNALCIGIQVLHAEAKRLSIKCLVV